MGAERAGRHVEAELGMGHGERRELLFHVPRELLSSSGAGGRDGLRVVGQSRVQLGDPSSEFDDAFVAAFQRAQALGRIGRPGQHLIDGGAVLAGQVRQLGASLPHRLEAQRVRDEVCEVAGEFGGQVVDQHGYLGGAGGQRSRDLVSVGQLSQRFARLTEQGDGAGRVEIVLGSADPALAEQRQPAQLVQVHELALLSGQCVVLAGLWADGVNLAKAEPQHVGLAGPGHGFVLECREFGGGCPPLGVVAPISVQLRRTGVGVEDFALALGAREPHLLGLAMDGGDLADDLSQGGHGHAGTADDCP